MTVSALVVGWMVTIQFLAAGLAEARSAGGLVVVECAHKEAGGASFDYETNELLRIFDEFVIRKYEEVVVEHEWARKPLAGE